MHRDVIKQRAGLRDFPTINPYHVIQQEMGIIERMLLLSDSFSCLKYQTVSKTLYLN